jgi:hypothetical protein
VDATDPSRAWRALCEQLVVLGDEVAAIDAAEGVRHLARQLAIALEGELAHADPEHPSFHLYEAPWSQWGAPNPDNVYVRAAIDPRATYRVWADVTGVRELLVSLMEGDMHLDEYGVFAERSLAELDVTADGTLELVVSPDQHDGNWLPTDPRARLLLIRQYQLDWERDTIATFSIEGVDRRGEPTPSPDAATIAAAVDRAATWVERSLHYWSAHSRRSAGAPPNAIGPPATPPGGAPHIAYGAGRFELAPHEALVITTDVPDADYWSWALHTEHWFDSGDFASCMTSLNHVQAHIDTDDRLRIVVAATDPGTPNWIDTGGRPRGMLAYRLIGARTRPAPTTAIIAVGEVRDHVPSDHPLIDAAVRRDQLARRRAAALARYA